MGDNSEDHTKQAINGEHDHNSFTSAHLNMVQLILPADGSQDFGKVSIASITQNPASNSVSNTTAMQNTTNGQVRPASAQMQSQQLQAASLSASLQNGTAMPTNLTTLSTNLSAITSMPTMAQMATSLASPMANGLQSGMQSMPAGLAQNLGNIQGSLQAAASNINTGDVQLLDGTFYNSRGYEICGQLNQHSKPCQRIGRCPFHEKKPESSIDGNDKKESRTLNPPKKSPYKQGWTKEEHLKFLTGLRLHDKGAWKEIASIVGTRTPTQIQSHAQKYYLRQKQQVKNKRSIHDTSLEELNEVDPNIVSSQQNKANVVVTSAAPQTIGLAQRAQLHYPYGSMLVTQAPGQQSGQGPTPEQLGMSGIPQALYNGAYHLSTDPHQNPVLFATAVFSHPQLAQLPLSNGAGLTPSSFAHPLAHYSPWIPHAGYGTNPKIGVINLGGEPGYPAITLNLNQHPSAAAAPVPQSQNESSQTHSHDSGNHSVAQQNNEDRSEVNEDGDKNDRKRGYSDIFAQDQDRSHKERKEHENHDDEISADGDIASYLGPLPGRQKE